MDCKTLAKKLRETQSKSKRKLLDEAADTLEALERDLKISALRPDGACTVCSHAGDNPDCDLECQECKRYCACYLCERGSLFRWRGI